MADGGNQLANWVRTRHRSIVGDLKLLEITFDVDQILRFQYDSGTRTVSLATSPKSKLGIVVAKGVDGLIEGQVRLDIE